MCHFKLLNVSIAQVFPLLCCYQDRDNDDDDDDMIIVGHLHPPTQETQKAGWASCCELILYKKTNSDFIVVFLHSDFHCTSDKEKHPISLTPVYFLRLIVSVLLHIVNE